MQHSTFQFIHFNCNSDGRLGDYVEFGFYSFKLHSIPAHTHTHHVTYLHTGAVTARTLNGKAWRVKIITKWWLMEWKCVHWLVALTKFYSRSFRCQVIRKRWVTFSLKKSFPAERMLRSLWVQKVKNRPFRELSIGVIYKNTALIVRGLNWIEKAPDRKIDCRESQLLIFLEFFSGRTHASITLNPKDEI